MTDDVQTSLETDFAQIHQAMLGNYTRGTEV
jgi:hypothetical protein